MSKSAKLLHLDPFAAAIARKEREAGGQTNDKREAANSTLMGTQALELREATFTTQAGGRLVKTLEAASVITGGQQEESAASQDILAGGNLPAKELFTGGNLPAEEENGRPQIETAGGRKIQKKERRPEDHKKLSLWFSRKKISEWKQFAEKTELTLTEFLDLAASRFMESVGTQKEEIAGGNPPHDDMMNSFWRTHDDIRMLYTEITGNRWRSTDDRIAVAYNSLDRRILEIGILSTAVRFKGKKINSFKYFVDEIEIGVEDIRESRMADESITGLLISRRAAWKKKKEGKW